MVGCRNANGVNGTAVEQLADITIGINGFSAIAEVLRLALEDISIHIAERDDADTWDLSETFNVTFALAIEADGSDSDVAIGAHHLRP